MTEGTYTLILGAYLIYYISCNQTPIFSNTSVNFVCIVLVSHRDKEKLRVEWEKLHIKEWNNLL